MTAPRVSVVVTCFNLGAYLDDAVQSVLDQTFQEFDVVIVDDGSTDEVTTTLLARLSRPKTRVLRIENRGLSAARNIGAAATTGEYLCMLDADDLLSLDMLEKSVAALDEDRSVAFVSHWVRTFGDEHRDWTPTRCDLPALLDVNTVNGAALVRREAFEAVNGFDETMRDGCEDWDFWISLVERGFQGRILPEVLFHYRRRADSMSRVMMEGDRHPRIYARLVAKHSESYVRNLETLIGRRDQELAHLERHLNDLWLEEERVLRPALVHAREDLALVERQAAAAEATRDRERALSARDAAIAELTRLSDETARRVSDLSAERDQLAASLTGAERTLGEMAQANRHAALEVAALRASWSWRMTAPLRAIYGLAVNIGKRRPR